MRWIAFAAVAVFAGSACGLADNESTTTTNPPSTTAIAAEPDLSFAEMSELTDLLDQWRQSALRRQAIDRWEGEVWDALLLASLDAMERGELGSGDCKIGRGDYIFDCDWVELVQDDFREMDRSGACAGWLRRWGCRNLDVVMEPFFDRWADRNLTDRQRQWLEETE